MNKFRLIANKILKAKYFATAFLVGIIFLAGGIMAFNAKDTKTSKAEATITDIVEGAYDSETETYSHTIYLTYKDAEGTEHNATIEAYDSSWEKGTIITISYDPENPDDIGYGSMSLKIVSYILIIIGSASILVGGGKLIIVIITTAEKNNEFNKAKNYEVPEREINKVKNSKESMKEYYFYYTQGFKPNYIMDTNPEHEKVMEAQNQKLAFFTNYQFNFVNHLTNKEEIKSCSHTITSEMENENALSFDMTANFKIDGKNCWEVLSELGYSIEPELKGAHAIFKVKKYGVDVAAFEQAGTNIMTGKDYKLGNIPTKGIYKVSCRESDIEGIFYCCFIVARTFDL